MASISKVMTLHLAFEAVHDGRLTMETPVPVSEHAYHMGGSQIWLEPGERFTLDEMIKAICVSSANDAAVAVAELVGGSEPAFVEQMNARAAALGMEQTTFRNACGLDAEGHLSTARDVAVMSRTILNTCPEVLHYTCLLYTSDAADEEDSVDLGGPRIIKKTKKQKKRRQKDITKPSQYTNETTRHN